MVKSYPDKRKFPRLLLAHRDEDYKALHQVRVEWPTGEQTSVLDISYEGLAVTTGPISQVGEKLKLKLKIAAQTFPIEAEVVRSTEAITGFKILQTTPQARLKIDQYLKDQIIGQNMRRLSPDLLAGEYKADIWFHGPFDSNFFIWRGADASIRKSIVEYDGLTLTYQNNVFEVTDSERIEGVEDKKSHGLTSEWFDRVFRLISQVPDPKKEIKPLFELLKNYAAKI